jgi:YD repeat-containing protein
VRDLTNGLLERTSYEWDQAGRPVAIRPPTGDVVTYRYAPDGARESATLPNGVDVGYQYDSLGRLVEMTYRDTAAREIAFFRYQYDTAGNRTSQVDTEGLTQYTYGALDRLVEARYPDGSYEKFSYL